MGLISKLFGKKVEEPNREFPEGIKPWSLTPIEAKVRAKMVVVGAKSHGIELNYSPESLADIDFLIDKERETKVGPTEEMQYVLVSIGAYVGEVMRQNLGGKWGRGVDNPSQDPVVMVINGKYGINVVSTVFKRYFAGEPFSVAKMYEETAKLKAESVK